MKTVVLCYVASACFGSGLTLGLIELIDSSTALLVGFLGAWALAGLARHRGLLR